MMRKILYTVIIASGVYASGFSQQPARIPKEIPAGYCISGPEYKLYKMINEYRKRYDLPPIPLSKSLCYVASTHVKDLFINHPDQGPCNSHSWSDKGTWKPFCYPGDEKKNNSVWDKPKEITNYKGKGYEIVYWENSPAVIDSIIQFWKSIGYFNSFLMSSGKWQGMKWNAIGIGICENYACAWFGELYDPEGEPIVCGMEPVKKPEEKPAASVPTEKQPVPSAPGKDTRSPQELMMPYQGIYYIVVKSQFPLEDMKKTAGELKAGGYPQAKVIQKDGKIRVSIMEFTNKAKADSALREVRKMYKDAWIYMW
jgi:hypothetical protein